MNILIYRLGSLGDTLIALPCFHAVRQTYPSAKITLLTNRPVHIKAASAWDLLGPTGLIDQVIDYPVGMRDPAALLRLIRSLRHLRIDLAIHLAAARGLGNSLRDWTLFKASGASRTIGIPFRHQDLTCTPVPIVPPNPPRYEWEAARLARRVAQGNIGIPEPALQNPAFWDLRITEEERHSAADHLAKGLGLGLELGSDQTQRPFLCIGIGTKQPHKDWSDSNWTKLIRILSDACQNKALPSNLGLVLIGSADEAKRSDTCMAAWSGPRLNLCGQLPPRVSAAILEKARLFIGPDSGPAHLAATVNTRCVAIFSNHNLPGQWFPRGGIKTCILYPEGTKQNLLDIHPEEVAAAALDLLQ